MELFAILAVGVVMGCSVYLMLQRSLLRVVFGTVLITHGVNLLLFTSGRLKRGGPPLLPRDAAGHGAAGHAAGAVVDAVGAADAASAAAGAGAVDVAGAVTHAAGAAVDVAGAAAGADSAIDVVGTVTHAAGAVADIAGAVAVTDPLPQSLILTSIVIGFATTALVLVIAYRIYQTHGTDDLDRLRGVDDAS